MAAITLNPKTGKGTIHKEIYGHFSEHLGRCIYQGIFVGEDSPIPNVRGIRTDVVEALKKIGVPVLRWPGGCFADEYHWQDGIGPLAQRRRMVNTNWGGVVEDNSFGTHEFLDLCQQIGCEPYINANVGSGTVREMAEWIEYVNSDGDSTVVRGRRANGREDAWGVKYWGIGNESWGCGGNMRPEYYADLFRQYQTFARTYDSHRPFRIACGASDFNYRWTEVLMDRAGGFMDGLSLHYYTVCGDTWQEKGSATDFSLSDYYKTLKKASRMDELIAGHDAIMTRYDPEKRVGLIVDEWGTWYDVEPGTNPGFLYQQNTMRDAMVAAVTLNIFNRHCDRVIMANLAQMVNVLQAVVLTEGNRLVLTPTYHVFDLYQAHQGAREVACFVESDETGEGSWTLPQITASASEKEGVVTVTAANLDAAKETELRLTGFAAKQVRARVLTGDIHAKNDFDASPIAPRAWPARVEPDGDVTLTLPACAVAEITLS
ncbi:MAG: alpha-N-arabinofuranosidase [Clostridia bacterium]|nr:alpha-N-arabinofuranosidase [Clostridia bacterium]MBQ9270031.1 alpha-N-arabinofuranosidase [Oscillospiraceae bacterium]